MRTWGQLIIGISESRGEFPIFDRLVRESVMHLFGRLVSVAEICFKLESWSVTVFPLKRGLNTSRAIVMFFVSIFPGVFCSHIEQKAIWSGNYLQLRSCLLFIYDISPGPL